MGKEPKYVIGLSLSDNSGFEEEEVLRDDFGALDRLFIIWRDCDDWIRLSKPRDASLDVFSPGGDEIEDEDEVESP